MNSFINAIGNLFGFEGFNKRYDVGIYQRPIYLITREVMLPADYSVYGFLIDNEKQNAVPDGSFVINPSLKLAKSMNISNINNFKLLLPVAYITFVAAYKDSKNLIQGTKPVDLNKDMTPLLNSTDETDLRKSEDENKEAIDRYSINFLLFFKIAVKVDPAIVTEYEFLSKIAYNRVKDDHSCMEFFFGASKYEIFDLFQALRKISPFIHGIPEFGEVKPSPRISRISPFSVLSKESLDKMMKQTNLLSREIAKELYDQVPCRYREYLLRLIYSAREHGFSLKTLYRNVDNYEDNESVFSMPYLFVIKDLGGKIFGAYVTDPPKIHPGYYGSGESFLFTVENGKLVIFDWNKDSREYILYGGNDFFSIGNWDGKFSLWLHESLTKGRSEQTNTFNNPVLSTSSNFEIQDFEVLAFERTNFYQ